MPKTRYRSRATRSVAAGVARAGVGRAHPEPIYPPGLPKSERDRFRRIFHRDVAMYEKALKRKLTASEADVVRQRTTRRIRTRQAALARRVSTNEKQIVVPPIPGRKKRDLMFGKAPSPHRGSTGLGGGTISRRRAGHRAVGRRSILHKPRWIDPYPWIPGTVPEKMIFDALVRRGIYFVFHGTPDDFDNDELLLFYAPTLHDFDFILPEYHVVIDPYSEFHHAQQSSIVRDVRRRTVLYAMGWNYYTPWAGEVVRDGGVAVVDGIVELSKPPVQKLSDKDAQAKRSQGYRLGAALGTGAFSVGIANRKRRRPPTIGLSRGFAR